MALGGDFEDEHVAYIASHLGFTEDTMHEFVQQLQEPSAIACTGAWFTIGEQPDVVRTKQGSRPGDSYADVVFGLLWAKLLKHI